MKIKPCPFCGKQPAFRGSSEFYYGFVECRNCQIAFFGINCLEKWNRRIEPIQSFEETFNEVGT